MRDPYLTQNGDEITAAASASPAPSIRRPTNVSSLIPPVPDALSSRCNPTAELIPAFSDGEKVITPPIIRIPRSTPVVPEVLIISTPI